MLTIISTLHADFIVSEHIIITIIIMENRPPGPVVVDADNIQGNHRPIFFMRIKHITRARDLP